MTRPTLNSIAKSASKPSSESLILATATDEQVSADLTTTPQHKRHLQSLSSSVINKSELLALFTLPSSEPFMADVSAAHTSVCDGDIANADADIIGDTIEFSVADQRLALYQAQHERTRLLYKASANSRPTYLVQSLKTQFIE